MAKKHSRIKDPPDGLHQTDFIEHGSEDHAGILGLEPCDKNDSTPYKRQDKQGCWWRLADPYGYAGIGAEPEYIQEVLRQKISELDSSMPEIQSDDPFAPGYAPPMYVPPELNPYTGEYHYPEWYKGRKAG